jgi:hypothetical protein
MENEIVNRVSTSPLVTIDLEEFYIPGERVLFDIKDQLFQGLILKEKSFREFVKSHQWSSYSGKLVAVTCSVEAIIPTWAYMLVSIALQPFAKKIVFGDLSELESRLFHEAIVNIDWEKYRDAKVVIKGCSKVEVPVSAYVEVTHLLRALASSIMYGEPCSTVPLFKKAKA